MDPTALWNSGVVFPLIEALKFLYNFLGSYGLAIIVFTVAVRAIMTPLTLQQVRSSKAMQELQPELQALQKKYGKEREKLAQETQRIYAEHGVNPLSGCLPTLIQMPIWIGLYSALLALAQTPEFSTSFLWITNLALPPNTQQPLANVLDFVLPVLCVVTQFITQKMMTPATQDPQAQSMNTAMSIMPLMFGFFTLSVPAGLTLYWVVSNLYSMVQQYFTTGLGSLAKYFPGAAAAIAPKATVKQAAKPAPAVVVTNPAPPKPLPAPRAVPTPRTEPDIAADGTRATGRTKTIQIFDQVTEPYGSADSKRRPKKNK